MFTIRSSLNHIILLQFLNIVKLFVENELFESDTQIVSQIVGVAGNVNDQTHPDVFAKTHSQLAAV